MNRISPDEVLTTPAGELAALASESLFQLKNDAADLLAAAKAIVEHVDRALDLKYADRAHQLRLAAGKDTGVVHFDDGHVRITADLPKKVDWDQTRLAEITRRIAANGDDPSDNRISAVVSLKFAEEIGFVDLTINAASADQSI